MGFSAIAAATVASAAIGASSASSAASSQKNAANAAADEQTRQMQQDQANFSPYLTSGAAANNALTTQLGLSNGGTGDFSPNSLLSGPSMTEAQLQTTPGYQFNLNTGLNAVQNSASARGLGTSGNALAGAATYATGLADNTYQNQYNNAVTNQTNQFNRLMGLTQLGQNSAAGVGAQGVQSASNIAGSTIAGGNAAAAGAIGVGSSLGNGLTTAAFLNSNNNGLYGNTSAPINWNTATGSTADTGASSSVLWN